MCNRYFPQPFILNWCKCFYSLPHFWVGSSASPRNLFALKCHVSPSGLTSFKKKWAHLLNEFLLFLQLIAEQHSRNIPCVEACLLQMVNPKPDLTSCILNPGTPVTVTCTALSCQVLIPLPIKGNLIPMQRLYLESTFN